MKGFLNVDVFVPPWRRLVAGALLLGLRAGFRAAGAGASRPQPAAGQPPAQPGRAAGADEARSHPDQAKWTKVCGHDQAANKDICYTTRDFGAQPDQPPVLALAVYDVKGEDTRSSAS